MKRRIILKAASVFMDVGTEFARLFCATWAIIVILLIGADLGRQGADTDQLMRYGLVPAIAVFVGANLAAELVPMTRELIKAGDLAAIVDTGQQPESGRMTREAGMVSDWPHKPAKLGSIPSPATHYTRRL